MFICPNLDIYGIYGHMTSIDFIILHMTHHLNIFFEHGSHINKYVSRASAKADCKASGLAVRRDAKAPVRRDAKAQGRKDTERAVEEASGSTVQWEKIGEN